MVILDLLNPNKQLALYKERKALWSFQLKFPKNVEALVYIYGWGWVGLASPTKLYRVYQANEIIPNLKSY